MSATDVHFREISRDEARAYWQSGEPCDKAGAYAIQGLGGAFVTRIDGSYSGVVGLPVYETLRLLSAAGLRIPSQNHRRTSTARSGSCGSLSNREPPPRW